MRSVMTTSPTGRVSYAVKPLDASTWPDFAALVERHNGVWGGCWCMGFHPEGLGDRRSAARNRSEKERRVREGGAHAALVFEGGACVGWCQFGPAAELPNIKSARVYQQGLVALPDWRITCFFISRRHRGKGVAAAALDGALKEIARLGGGVVESYPADMPDAKLANGFGHNATVAMFERRGFQRTRQLSKTRWVVARQVAPDPSAAEGAAPRGAPHNAPQLS
jgi:GNAT superfamily N-acetyltransferase